MTDEASIAIQIKTILNSYLTDPRTTAGGETRSNWSSFEMPRTDATYPRIQIETIEGSNDILSIGTDYGERTFCYYKIHFYTKDKFKINVMLDSVNRDIQDESLVSYYLKQMKTTLKTHQNTTQDLKVDGFKMLSTSPVIYDSDTKLHHGYIVVRYWYFTIPE